MRVHIPHFSVLPGVLQLNVSHVLLCILSKENELDKTPCLRMS